MQPKYAKIISFLYGPWIRLFGFIGRTFSANRARLERLKASRGVAGALRFISVVVWILVWLFASETDRTRFTSEVRQSIDGLNNTESSAEPSHPPKN